MNKQEAAKYLGVSTRAIERYTAKGKLLPKYERGRTGPAPVYERSQLDTLKQEMSEALNKPNPVIKADKPVKSDKSDKLVPHPKEENSLAMFITAINNARSQSASEIAVKLLLSINEAQRLTGLSNKRLRNAIQDGKLKGKIIGRGYKVKRTDLDAYIRKI